MFGNIPLIPQKQHAPIDRLPIRQLMILFKAIPIKQHIMKTLEEKQHYITSQVSEEDYEAFYDYVGEAVGNFDIEKWPSDFLVDLVKKFHASRKEQDSKLETSFYQYQHAPVPAVQTMPTEQNILPRELTQEEEVPNSLVMLDGIFRRNSFKKVQEKKMIEQDERKFKKESKVFVETPPPPKKEPFKNQPETRQFQTMNPPKTQVSAPVPAPFFEKTESNFWGVQAAQAPTSQKPVKAKPDFANFDDFGSKKTTTTHALPVMQAPSPQPVKSTADFASFDFWSEPSKSPGQFKSMNLPPKPVQAQKPSQTTPIPSFEQLMANIAQDKQKQVQKEESTKIVSEPVSKPQKSGSIKDPFDSFLTPQVDKKPQGPSPYQKKAYPLEKSPNQAKKRSNEVMGGRDGFKDMVKCFPAALRPRINVDNLQVAITAHQVVNRTFLMPDYVMFTLNVKPLGISVKRNYEDFQRLRMTLSKHYPGFKLSYLESSSWFGSTSPEYVSRQIIWLEFFINDILHIQELRNSRILEEFLMLPQHKQIKRKFEEYQKLQKPKGLEDLCLLPGRVTVAVNDHQRRYQDQLKVYQEKMVGLMQKQQRLSDHLTEHYRRAGQTLMQLQQVAESVISETKAFNKSVYGLEIEEIEEVYSMIKDCYEEETKNVYNSVESLSKLQTPFLSYEKENLKQLGELLGQQQSMLRAYLKRKQYQKEDPKTTYDSKQHAAFKLGVLQQSRSFVVLKYQAGYLSNQVCLQAKRVFETLGMKTARRWEEYCLKRRDISARQLDFYRDNCNYETAEKM